MSEQSHWFTSATETGLFHSSRTKTKIAIQRLSLRMREKDWDRLPQLIVFAPPENMLGVTFGLSVTRVVDAPSNLCVLYLSPKLEVLSQREVDRSVAHEFAHAILGHQTGEEHSAPQEDSERYRNHPSEIAADELIQQWGYPPAHKRT